ncbi:MAG TPA: aldo/keto reductase [Atopostipes sp.]|nr:aldo/keto reductase [Atopostipes sp.]
MQKRNLGYLEVSEIGIGAMGFSHGYGEVPSEEYAIEAIREAFAYGCTFIDTAEVYGTQMFYPGHNEELVGKAIEPFREEIVLATKLFIRPDEFGEDVTLYEAIRSHLNASLQNLRTDYIDLYYWHRVNEEIPIEEVVKVMRQLIDEGLIKGWGLSQVGTDLLKRAHEVTPVSAVQNLYNMMERTTEEIFDYCLENNIGIVPFSPVASGYLSGKVTTETKFEGDDVRKWVPQTASKENIIANQPILDLVSEFAESKNATNAQISIAWMLRKHPNIVPIPGSKNKERIIENLASSKVELMDDEFEALETALEKIEIHGHRGHIETVQNPFTKRISNEN